jgi:hypothetical protein
MATGRQLPLEVDTKSSFSRLVHPERGLGMLKDKEVDIDVERIPNDDVEHG